MKVRSIKRIALGALVLGSIVGAVGPLRDAQAAPGGAITIYPSGLVKGTTGDDVFILGREGEFLTHNRFAAGDPGFVSRFDFESTTEGEQKRAPNGGGPLSFELDAGDDTVKLVGAVADPNAPRPGFNLGSGYDTVDASESATGVYIEPGVTVEKMIGSPHDDQLIAAVNAPGISTTILAGEGNDRLIGTEGNDVLDGGPGTSLIEGRAGDDSVTIGLPLSPTFNAVDVGEGFDTVIVRGDAGNDALEVSPGTPDGGTGVVFDNLNTDDPAVAFSAERIRLELMGGDDVVVWQPMVTSITVDGGDGDDGLIVDGGGQRVNAARDGADRVFTAPLPLSDAGVGVRALPTTENFAAVNETMIATATGPGGAPHVRAFRGEGTQLASFYAYGANFTGGVNVALGDLDGDRDDEIITGVGPGGGPHVRAFHSDGSDAGTSFYAYDPKFTGGVNVAAIDLDGDGFSEIVTAPASGGGPHIRIWSGDGELLDEWFAPGFQGGGFKVARGSVFGELGGDQIIVSSLGGQPSRVAVFEEFGEPAPQFGTLQPYDPAFLGGVAVSRGEFTTPARGRNHYQDEIVTGAGPGGGPDIRVYETSINTLGSYTLVSSFYGFGANFPGGVDVATCNYDGGDDEILLAAGPGGAPHVRLVNKTGGPAGISFYAYGENFHGGVRVACGGGGFREIPI